ncbi:hypothetical protein Afil01_43060 [Actinorhabdospora filicis]|uniref:Winged helix-turn-helix domain-containing protein n=1 Tax=Actinorhabdospora filicis TaxID=1785913 RepID=A0A9W6SM71_9ACTN|nr:crosslink repair DNA glycosylase YcaQ family protein [Actinorhabdospora filicis]GLZ79499.1 hypothetical protein Afil01_43060 [Actinorhabdospora filicis]
MIDTLSLPEARALAVAGQRLGGPRPGPEALPDVLRALRFLQLDPISVVAPSHELVLRSRVAGDVRAAFAAVMARREMFEYWTHAAAIVLTEDYPLHRVDMDAYPRWPVVREWIADNHVLRDHILTRLGEGVPTATSGFEDLAVRPWESTGWTKGRNVERMLTFLWRQGRVMVAGRVKKNRLWALPEACLPAGAIVAPMEAGDAAETAIELALKALGVARAADLKSHFLGDLYLTGEVLDALLAQGRAVEVRVEGGDERWFTPADPAVAEGGRTVFLSPFDGLIADRKRAERLWGFAFKNEMYVPKDKREYGYYVLPLLRGNDLAGRAALRADRKKGELTVEGLFFEKGEPGPGLREEVEAELAELAVFAGVG